MSATLRYGSCQPATRRFTPRSRATSLPDLTRAKSASLRALLRRPGERPGISPRSRSVSPAGARGVDDGGKQCTRGRVVCDEVFGMPLHGDGEAPLIGVLERLDHVVGRSSDLPQVAPEAVNRLVVEAVHAKLGDSDDGADPRVFRLQLHVVGGDVAPVGLAMLDLVAEHVGTCWCSVPPSATFSTCSPRQIANTGTSSRSARSTSSSSRPSRSAETSVVLGCAASPNREGSTSPPPVRTSPSSRAQSASRAAEASCGASKMGTPPACSTARRYAALT